MLVRFIYVRMYINCSLFIFNVIQNSTDKYLKFYVSILLLMCIWAVSSLELLQIMLLYISLGVHMQAFLLGFPFTLDLYTLDLHLALIFPLMRVKFHFFHKIIRLTHHHLLKRLPITLLSSAIFGPQQVTKCV